MKLSEVMEALARRDCRKLKEIPFIWFKENVKGLSVVKGWRAHFITKQNGDVEQIRGEGEGRDRIGFWVEDLRCIRTLRTYLQPRSLPLGERASGYAYGLGWKAHLYSVAPDVEIVRLDFVSLDKPLLFMNYYSSENLEVTVEIEVKVIDMWPHSTLYRIEGVSCNEGQVLLRTRRGVVGFSVKQGEIECSGEGEVRVLAENSSLIVACLAREESLCKRLLDHAIRRYEEEFEHVTKYYEDLVLKGTVVRTPDDELNKVFLTSKYVLAMLYSHTPVGRGIFAGMPRFSWFFTGDVGLMASAYLAVCFKNMVREHLKTMVKYAKDDGQIPHEVVLIPSINARKLATGYWHIDATPLWILTLHKLYKWTGDESFVKEFSERVDKAISFLRGLDLNHDGFIETQPEKGLIAMDEVLAEERKGACVELNALYIKALESASELMHVTGFDDKAIELKEEAHVLREKFTKEFWDDFCIDVILNGEKVRRVMPYLAMLTYLEIIDGERGRALVRKLFDELVTPYGVSLGKFSGPKEGYYLGSVWPLYTGLLAVSAFKYGLHRLGFKLLNILRSLAIKASDPGKISEYYEHDTGCERGQFVQGFSSSQIIDIILTGILGVDVDAAKPRITFNIRMPEKWAWIEVKGLRIGHEVLDVKLKRTEEGYRYEVFHASGKKNLLVEIFLASNGYVPLGRYEEKIIHGCRMYGAKLYLAVNERAVGVIRLRPVGDTT
ncbi:MAG: hypothetical protein DRN15_06530 [Thermoprotei archaeon]|nr:MAG: hypothetical protein DRN15_06530 [Thermoprotei archaeon]RLF25492.1 MAG: hypothetical protein DRM97_01645 [Thermoprotei archaeon]